MLKLYDKSTGKYLGRIEEEEMQFLRDNLEEESLTDVDYYLNRTTFDLLKEEGMSENLEKLIETAMGNKNEVEIRYEEV
jgi:hypothetical protein